MYCTKCGKETHDQDRFCAFCGAELRQVSPTKYDDIVFNPPFREEAKRKTEEIKDSYTGFKSTDEKQKKTVKREKVDFDWGTEKREEKKSTDNNFDWSQVLEEKNRQIEGKDVSTDAKSAVIIGTDSVKTEPRNITVDKIDKPGLVLSDTEIPEVGPIAFAEPIAPITVETEEEPMSIEDLERELFGEKSEWSEKRNTASVDIPSEVSAENDEEKKPQDNAPKIPVGDERFYTYNQKCDAFDQLIEKEKERVGAEAKIFNRDKKANAKNNVKGGHMYIPPAKTIAVEPVGKYDSLAPTFEGGWPDDEYQIPSQGENGESIVIKDLDDPSIKLRYSDVFPRVPVDENGNPLEGYSSEPEVSVRHDPVVPGIIAKNKERQAEERKNAEQNLQKRPERTVSEARLTGIFDAVEIDEDEPKKKHVFARIVITLLIVLMICEGAVFAVKFFIPDSLFSQWITDTSVKVLDVLSGKTEKVSEEPVTEESSQESYMRMLVADAATSSKKIGEITYATDVKYDDLTSFAFSEASTAAEFEDEDWFTTKDGEQKTYGQVLMSTLVSYFEGWKDINKDETLLGINKLEIGETRIGEEGFFTLVRITYAGADGIEIIKYQTIYTRIADKSIVINMVKEENK